MKLEATVYPANSIPYPYASITFVVSREDEDFTIGATLCHTWLRAHVASAEDLLAIAAQLTKAANELRAQPGLLYADEASAAASPAEATETAA